MRNVVVQNNHRIFRIWHVFTKRNPEVLDQVVVGGVTKVHNQRQAFTDSAYHGQAFASVGIELMVVRIVFMLPQPNTKFPLYNKKRKGKVVS